jgi:putative salt-induced outer membrane protein YdiY
MNRFLIALQAFALLLLLAPAVHAGDEDEGSDEKTAEEKAEKAGKTAEEAGKTAEEKAEKAGEAVEEAAEEATEAATEAAEEATEAVEEAVDEAPETAVEAVTEAAEAVEEAEEAESKPEVTLSAEAGGLWLAGNTKSLTVSGGVNFGVAHGKNKFSLLAGGAYGRGVVAGDATNTWLVTATRVFGDARYDRFLIQDLNSIYVAAGAFHDPFAGFDLRFQGNLGYSHLLVATDIHKLALEGGVNYTRDEYVDGVDPNAQNFVGGRVFVGYKLTPTDSFGFGQSVEALVGGTDNVDARFDGRLLSTTEVTAQVSKVFGIKLGFLLNWDFEPPEGFAPVDTTTSVTLVATIL